MSSERSTWFTAALLQLGSVTSSNPTNSGSSRKQSSRATDDEPSGSSREVSAHKKRSDALQRRRKSTSTASSRGPLDGNFDSHGEPLLMVDTVHSATKSQSVEEGASNATLAENRVCRYIRPKKLDEIWEMCIDRCHSNTLRQLLRSHARLVSIAEVEGETLSSLLEHICFKCSPISLYYRNFK